METSLAVRRLRLCASTVAGGFNPWSGDYDHAATCIFLIPQFYCQEFTIYVHMCKMTYVQVIHCKY